MSEIFNPVEYEKMIASKPYPKVVIEQPNLRYAKIVSDAYGGKGSESTAISQYGVHRLYLQKYPEAYEAYKSITMVEMIHWRLLGNLIMQFGAAPRIRSYQTQQYWNGSFPMYRKDFPAIIASDIEGEQQAIAHYKRMILQIPNESVKKLFLRIIEDEQGHIEILNALEQYYSTKG